ALGQVDVVPAIEQLIAADRVDREREGYAGTADGLPFEVDGDLLRRRLAYHGGQLLDVRLRGDRGEQPVLHGILRKDIAERRCDDATKTVIVQGIDRRLARGAAAEIATPQQNLRAAVSILVEREVRPRLALCVKAH